MLTKHYPELLPDWNIEVENIWKVMLEILEKKPSLILHKAEETITFHDNCSLGRYCKIYDEPRKILALLGYTIKEMENHRETSFCCGSCGGLPRIDEELANNLAKERIAQAKRIHVKKMIVTSFDNYDLLIKNASDKEIEILELSEILAQALNLSIEKQASQEEDPLMLVQE
jgi:Fe-S oxidoreductase